MRMFKFVTFTAAFVGASIGLAVFTEAQDDAAPAAAAVQAEVNADTTADAPAADATQTQDVSYALGYDIGSSLARQGLEVDATQVAEGLRAGLGEAESRMTPDEVRAVLTQLQDRMRQRMVQRMQEEASANVEQGRAFIEQKKQEEGVQVTESGLAYKVIEEGDGASPDVSDVVVAHYRGTLVDGTQFDSSYEGGNPIQIRLDQVIPGWTEGLQLMKEGAKYEFYIPAELAYGQRGQGQVPPGATLIFEVELLEVKQQGEEAEAGAASAAQEPAEGAAAEEAAE